MSYSLSTSSSELLKHDYTGHFTLVLQPDGNCSVGDGLPEFESRVALFERHGWWMWLAWGPVGFLMLYLKRYAKNQWKLAHVAHAVFGHFILWVTLGQQLNIYLFWEWNVRWTYSAIINTITVVLAVILCITGQVVQSIMGWYNGDLPWSRKEKVTNWAKFHRYFGYIVLFLANLTNGIGTLNYTNHFVHNEYRSYALWMGPAHTITFCLLVVFFEILYRRK